MAPASHSPQDQRYFEGITKNADTKSAPYPARVTAYTHIYTYHVGYIVYYGISILCILHYFFPLQFDLAIFRLKEHTKRAAANIQGRLRRLRGYRLPTNIDSLVLNPYRPNNARDGAGPHTHSHSSRDLTHLDKDIEDRRRAISHSQEASPCALGQLARSYQNRFRHGGLLGDLDKAIEYATLALSCSPPGHPCQYGLLNILGIYHHQRFHRLGKPSDLDKDIEYKARAVSLKPEGNLPMLAALCQSHRTRFTNSGNTVDLDKSIEYGTLAVSLSAHDDPDLLWRLNQLGATYGERFRRLDDPSDLDQFVKCESRIVSLTPSGDRDMPKRINNLAAAHDSRYHRLHDSRDLEKAKALSMEVLSLTTAESQDEHIKALVNLSVLCLSGVRAVGDLHELQKGIDYSASAYSLTGGNHPLEPIRLQNLSALYHERFQRTGKDGDLESAIEYSALAVSLTPDGDRQLGNQLSDLGHYVHARWHHLGDANDLEKDLEYKARAVSLTPEYHPDLPSRLENLGRSYLGASNRAAGSNRSLMLYLACDSFRRACRSEVGAPNIKFKSALKWAHCSRSPEERLDAFQAAIDLIPHVVWLGTTVSQRYRDISDVTKLSVEAASAAVQAGDYERALEWLEQSRSIVMNQSLMLRSPIDHLRSVDPSLAQRLQEIAEELTTTASRAPCSNITSSAIFEPHPEDIALRHRQLAKEHAEIISRVRQIPAFEDFLQPKKAAQLRSAARTGPVVVINFAKLDEKCSCDALIVRPGSSELGHLKLSAFNSRVATDVLSQFDAALIRGRLTERGISKLPVRGQIPELERVLALLWNSIVKPILDFLSYKPNPLPENLPHITWCTTGELSSLPLHAAGVYRGSKICLADYAISSYTPTLTALLSASPNTATSSILAVGQEETAGHSRLPGTAQELSHIREHINANTSMTSTQISNDKATPSAVLDAMERHDCVHFACHAHQNIEDPTKSGFFLHEGTLNLLSIMERSFKNKGLAFLSACQTAKGDGKLPDETIHLAAGMLTAGYPSVIAAMWSVWDRDAPFIADRVYGMLLKNGKMNCQESARALHFAVADLRKEIGDDKFIRWVPFIHIGS